MAVIHVMISATRPRSASSTLTSMPSQYWSASLKRLFLKRTPSFVEMSDVRCGTSTIRSTSELGVPLPAASEPVSSTPHEAGSLTSSDRIRSTSTPCARSVCVVSG